MCPNVSAAAVASPSKVALIERAAAAAAEGARPLNFNGFKIPLLANLVQRGIRGAAT